ncbi:MAG: hypothetical protein JEZ07_13840, partial [Phycisphaerae bacterium]|nr:hypothetical protein [Phycisphaerae bacterium]
MDIVNLLKKYAKTAKIPTSIFNDCPYCGNKQMILTSDNKCPNCLTPFGSEKSNAKKKRKNKPNIVKDSFNGQYFETDPVPSNFGLCSDDLCPCPEVSIPRGTGYLYIDKETVDFRRQYPKIKDAEIAIKIELMKNQLAMKFDRVIFQVPTAKLVCEQGAKLRNLDLQVAGEDARHWWKTGLAPLRATPLASKKHHHSKN